jgi:hypothetical protein
VVDAGNCGCGVSGSSLEREGWGSRVACRCRGYHDLVAVVATATTAADDSHDSAVWLSWLRLSAGWGRFPHGGEFWGKCI